MKKHSPLTVGLFNLLAPIPVLLLSAVAACFLFFVVGFGIFGFDNVPTWFRNLSLLPALLSVLVLPVIQILGVVLGIMKRREKHAVGCIVLSGLGFAVNTLLWAAALWAGMHY